MIKYYIIGVGPGDPELITKKAEKTVYKMNVLAGGKRQLAMFPNFSGPKVVIGGNLGDFWQVLHTYSPPYGILASGDPTLYGILEFVKKMADLSEIEVIPGISSIQYLLAKEKESFWKIEVVSHHWKERVKGGAFRAFLSPEASVISRDDLVGENLSLPNERIGRGIFPKTSLSVSVKKLDKIIVPGFPDEFFKKGSSPMTKKEIRILIISALSLPENGIVWDLGAGTGAISCEIAHAFPSITVYAVEKTPDRAKLIQENIKKLNLFNVKVVEGDALWAIDGLPDPSSVFIGGGGERIEDIMGRVYERILKGGKIVFSAITLDTAYRGYHFLERLTREPRLFSIHIEDAYQTRGGLTMMIARNRIFVGEGVK